MKTFVLALALVLTTAGIAGAQQPDRGRFDDWSAVSGDAASALVRLSSGPSSRPRTAGTDVVFAQVVPDAARDSYRRALQRLDAGDGAAASALLREAVAGYTDYFDANVMLGVLGVSGRRYAEAESALATALRVNDRDPKAHYYRAVALVGLSDANAEAARRAGRLEEAMRELGRAADLGGPALTAVHFQRARILERLGDREAAADAVEEYLRLAPDEPNAASLRAAVAKLRAR